MTANAAPAFPVREQIQDLYSLLVDENGASALLETLAARPRAEPADALRRLQGVAPAVILTQGPDVVSSANAEVLVVREARPPC